MRSGFAAPRATAPAPLCPAIHSFSRSPSFYHHTPRDPCQGSSRCAYFSPWSPRPTVAAAAGSKDQASSPPPNSYLEGLNAKQLEAVTGPLVPARVNAGPGSGKTKTLTSRIAHLISHHGVQTWQILAITFTNKAATEMRERLEAVLGIDAASQLFAGTFHSLCYRILLKYLPSLPNSGRTVGWSIYDADASLAVMYKIIRAVNPDLETNDARALAKEVQARISRVKNGVARYYDLQIIDAVYDYYRTVVLENSTESITPGGKAFVDDLADWFEMYEQAMRAANALDFDDLLGYTTAVLQHNVEVREKLRRRWKHVLVDEFQDTNSQQYELVKLLAGVDDEDSNNSGSGGGGKRSGSIVFAVGDTDQAIYGFRGADVRNMRTLFQNDFPESLVYRLRDNYRSTPGILKAAQAVISRIKDVDRAELVAHRPEGPRIRICFLEDVYQEAESIAQDIATLIRSDTCKDRDIAVLFRTHMQARFIEQQLVKENIPYVLVGGVSFWRRVEILDILAYARVAITLNDDIALKRIINTPKRGLGDVSVTKLELAGAKSEGGTLSSFLFPINEVEGLQPLPLLKKLLSAKAAASVEQFRSNILQMRHALATQPLSEALQRIIELSGYIEHLNKGGCGGKGGDVGERKLRLEHLVAAAMEFKPGTAAGAAVLDAAFAAMDIEENEKDNERISRLFNSNPEKFSADATSAAPGPGAEKEEEDYTIDPDESLEIARAFLDEAALYSGVNEGADVDGVRLMTMHAAKGLEFDVVFVPGCVEGLVPMFNPARGDTEKDLEEETRLFFVAMTRAKQELCLLHTEVNVIPSRAYGCRNYPSRYLGDVFMSGHAVCDEYSMEIISDSEGEEEEQDDDEEELVEEEEEEDGDDDGEEEEEEEEEIVEDHQAQENGTIYIIYHITCIETGRFYVGMTTNLDQRIKSHKYNSSSRRLRAAVKAAREAGVPFEQAFRWGILATATSIEAAEEKERYYIGKLGANKKGNFNYSSGGFGNRGRYF